MTKRTTQKAPKTSAKKIRAVKVAAPAKSGNGHSPKTLQAVAAAQVGALVVKLGDITTFEAPNMAAAQALFCAARDASGKGASEWPNGDVYSEGTKIGHISYNGRAWDLSGAIIGDEPVAPAAAKSEAAPAGEEQSQLEVAQAIKVSLKHLRAALAIAPKKDTRYYLNGVFLHTVSDTELRIVATDGHRMLVISTTVDAPISWGEAGVILPREQLDRVVKFASGGDSELISIGYGKEHPHVSLVETSGLARFAVTPIDGRFPDYQKVVADASSALVGREGPADATAVNSDYLKSAGVIAAQLESKTIFPFVGEAGKAVLFTFGDVPGAMLYVMGVRSETAGLAPQTVRLIGDAGMAGTLTALKAHETRARKAADAAKTKKEREELGAKAEAFAARIAEIRGALANKLTGPTNTPTPEATAEDSGEEASE